MEFGTVLNRNRNHTKTHANNFTSNDEQEKLTQNASPARLLTPFMSTLWLIFILRYELHSAQRKTQAKTTTLCSNPVGFNCASCTQSLLCDKMKVDGYPSCWSSAGPTVLLLPVAMCVTPRSWTADSFTAVSVEGAGAARVFLERQK